MIVKIRTHAARNSRGSSAKAQISRHLHKLSEKARRAVKARTEFVTPLKRQETPTAVLTPVTRESGKTTKVTVNVSGNLRGMHNSDNSEGMRKIRAMRKFYNKKMPTLQCNGCAFTANCPQYKPGYECAFLPFLNSHKIDTYDDLVEYMKDLVGANMRRTQQTLIMETLQGGKPSLETSEAIALAFQQLKELEETMTNRAGNISITAEGEDTSVIAKIFGGLANLQENTRRAHETPIVPLLPESKAVDILPEKAESFQADVNHDLIREHSRDELKIVSGGKRGNEMPELQVSKVIKV